MSTATVDDAGPGWRWAGACVAGTAHEARGIPCQDRFAVTVVRGPAGGEILVVAASDGAGSVANAEAGAEAVVAALTAGAVAHAAAHGLDGLDRETVESWVEDARGSLDLGLGLRRSFAATLCLAVVGADRAVYAQIGDGALAARYPDGSWSLPVQPRHGPEAATTTFFTDNDWRANLEFAATLPPDAVAVMTDGLEPLLVRMSDMTVHVPAAEGLLAPVLRSGARGDDAALSEGLAGWMRGAPVVARTHDDKTLVVAAR